MPIIGPILDMILGLIIPLIGMPIVQEFGPRKSPVCGRSIHTISPGGFLFKNVPNYLVEGFWTRQHEARQKFIVAIFIIMWFSA